MFDTFSPSTVSFLSQSWSCWIIFAKALVGQSIVLWMFQTCRKIWVEKRSLNSGWCRLDSRQPTGGVVLRIPRPSPAPSTGAVVVRPSVPPFAGLCSRRCSVPVRVIYGGGSVCDRESKLAITNQSNVTSSNWYLLTKCMESVSLLPNWNEQSSYVFVLNFALH